MGVVVLDKERTWRAVPVVGRRAGNRRTDHNAHGAASTSVGHEPAAPHNHRGGGSASTSSGSAATAAAAAAARDTKIDDASFGMLLEMGFHPRQAQTALRKCGALDPAIEWLFVHGDSIDTSDTSDTHGADAEAEPAPAPQRPAGAGQAADGWDPTTSSRAAAEATATATVGLRAELFRTLERRELPGRRDNDTGHHARKASSRGKPPSAAASSPKEDGSGGGRSTSQHASHGSTRPSLPAGASKKATVRAARLQGDAAADADRLVNSLRALKQREHLVSCKSCRL